jgi:hypothetical protein
LLKAVIPFYIICLALYILFSRQPDFQDGEFTPGIIHYNKDSTGKRVPEATFSVNKTQYTINAAYPLLRLQEGQLITIIYETNNPSHASVYSWWGYWLQWDELLASILIPLVLLYAAKAITAGPDPEALLEELEMRDPPKRKKYD